MISFGADAILRATSDLKDEGTSAKLFELFLIRVVLVADLWPS
jgi:hypothetical protein